ncbi:hypothetical protein EK904_008676 [Melospiza melodia maxima]|nr:hypothetical protein EK904_008676 [Melospiza melodia maxima]
MAVEVQMFVVNHNSHMYVSAVVAVQVAFFFSGLSWQDPFLLSSHHSSVRIWYARRSVMMDGQPEPHYRSFDGKTSDFMGTCAYNLTTIYDPDPTLPAFSIEVKKEEKVNSKVSSMGSITNHIDNITVTTVLSENGMMRISKNQVSSHHSCLPMSLSHGELHIYQKGKSMLIQSNFKLKVLYNWDNHLVIKLLAALSGKVCGMCRNNRELWDDALPPDIGVGYCGFWVELEGDQ